MTERDEQVLIDCGVTFAGRHGEQRAYISRTAGGQGWRPGRRTPSSTFTVPRASDGPPYCDQKPHDRGE